MNQQFKDKMRRTPWDVVAMLIGMLACAIGIIAMLHGDMMILGGKIDAFQAEMRDLHGRTSAMEVVVWDK